jgi:hypothetical protein
MLSSERSIDLTDFYLGTHNPFPQFLKIYLADYYSAKTTLGSLVEISPFLENHLKMTSSTN